MKQHYKIALISVAIATVMSGCSTLKSFKKEKEVVDLGPQASEQVYFDKAQKALDKKQYLEATKNLEAIKSYYPTGEYVEQAELNMIYSKFQQKDYENTIKLAERFIAAHPQFPDLDYVYYVRGVANMEQNYDSLIRYTSLKHAHRDTGYLKLAYQNFKDLIIRYPSSQYAVDAAQRMIYIGQELAESEMNVARFNLERKAWLAALERSQWVIEHYPQTPQVAEAVATVAYCYDKLGDTQAANKYIEVLKANYPHLVKSNNHVNLNAARKERSIWNKATLGLFGQNTESQNQPSNTSTTEDKPSLLNKLSFGLLGKDKTNSDN